MFKSFEQTLYIKVWENAFEIWHVQNDVRLIEHSSEPFTSERMAVGYWTPAQITLNNAFAKICPRNFLKFRPVAVVQQMVKMEGGLCEVEKRMLEELALGAGARKVFLWFGEPLSKEQLLSHAYKTPKPL